MSTVFEEYSRRYEPAAPAVNVTIDGYRGRPAVEIEALIDSGADGTMLPINILKDVGAAFSRSEMMRGVLGDFEPVDVYIVAVNIGAIRVQGIRAVGMPEDSEAIIGRDVLNQLTVTLDGPALTLRIDD